MAGGRREEVEAVLDAGAEEEAGVEEGRRQWFVLLRLRMDFNGGIETSNVEGHEVRGGPMCHAGHIPQH